LVRAFFPQGRNSNISSNTNYPPQGEILGGGGVPTFNDEEYVNSGQRGSSAYVNSGQRGKVDYEDLI